MIRNIYIILFLALSYAGVDYNSEIQPIFDNSCTSCHKDGGTYFGGLDLSSYSEVMEGGNSGNVVVPFDYANSLLWQHVNSYYMPPYGSGNDILTTIQINLIAQWIDEGALLESHGIEGRWHLVGWENAIMYQFVDTEVFADAGLRYTIYVNEDGGFDDLDGDNTGGTPDTYSVEEDIITIDYHFGNIASYQMIYRCEGQVVDFVYTSDDIIHSTLFREFYDYSQCQSIPDECSLTTDDILGPYYFEDAPFRNIIAHEDEPGQRLYISGSIKQNNCENNISGTLIELWQANDEGCYSIVEDCNTGNPENDYFNLRGKFFSDENGNFTFESILPGYYGTRPKHIHIKVTTPDEEILVSQLYFGNDPYCENDVWCQDADGRIISLVEDEYGLNGEIDLIMNSLENGILLGDINFDNVLNVQDIVLLAGIILDNSTSNDLQIYSSDINNDNNIDVLDIIHLVNTILNSNNQLPDGCYIIPEVGPCDGICPTYYYNQNTNQCEEFITGCCGVESFNTIQSCIDICE